jgi:hypothetical protein
VEKIDTDMGQCLIPFKQKGEKKAAPVSLLAASLQIKPPVAKEILSSDWLYSQKRIIIIIIMSWFRWIIRGHLL